jgi:hypothetical protein
MDDGCRDVFAGKFISEEEVGRRPGLGKIGHFGDDGVGLVGMRKGSVGVGRRRWNFNLGSGFHLSGFRRPGMRIPADRYDKQEAESQYAQDGRKERIEARRAGRRRGDARDLRHINFEARR